MAELHAEPGGKIRSMEEFFALAHAMEMDAATRYEEAARKLRHEGFDRLADVFAHLADMERQHVGQVEQWAERRASPIAEPPWSVPSMVDPDFAEITRSGLATPYAALASAVRHEQRAFAFWSYVAAYAVEPQVKTAAEKMAIEELEHASLLRRERRLAFRAERKEGKAISLGDLANLERHLAALLEQRGKEDWRPFAATLAGEARTAAARLDACRPVTFPQLLSLPANRRDDVLSVSEYLAEKYLRLADGSKDDQLLATAQDLAAIAVKRLGMLDPAFPALAHPSPGE
jgi:rubrerythrin